MAIAQLPVIAERSAQTIWTGTPGDGTGQPSRPAVARCDDLPGDVGVPDAAIERQDQPRGVSGGGPRLVLLDGSRAPARRTRCPAAATRSHGHGLTGRCRWSSDRRLLRPCGSSRRSSTSTKTPSEAIVDEAVALCPISRLFAGAAITVDANLDGT